MLDAMARCLSRPFAKRIELQGGWAEKALDLYPEARLRGVIVIADDLKSETAWELTSRCLDEVLARWQEHSPDIEGSVGILNALEGASWERIQNETELSYVLRAKLLDELQDATQCSDFMFVDEYAKETKEKFTDEENEKFSNGFMNYINKWLPQEISEVDTNADQLKEIADFLSKMMKDYGYNIGRSYGRIMEVITQLEDHEEQRADTMYDEWKDGRAFERADEEAIDSMFSSLI